MWQCLPLGSQQRATLASPSSHISPLDLFDLGGTQRHTFKFRGHGTILTAFASVLSPAAGSLSKFACWGCVYAVWISTVNVLHCRLYLQRLIIRLIIGQFSNLYILFWGYWGIITWSIFPLKTNCNRCYCWQKYHNIHVSETSTIPKYIIYIIITMLF